MKAAAFRYPGERSRKWITLGILFAALFTVPLQHALMAVAGIVMGLVALALMLASTAGHGAKVSTAQLPEIHELCVLAAKRLKMELPPVFVVRSPQLNAYAAGVFRATHVVLHSALVEALSPQQLLFVIGHEFSHVKCGHTRLGVLTGGTIIQIPIITPIMKFLFLSWSRRAEFSADRGGLIACRDIDAARGALCCLSVGSTLARQINQEALLKQQLECSRSVWRWIAERSASHPFLPQRLMALQEYSSAQGYQNLIEEPVAKAA